AGRGAPGCRPADRDVALAHTPLTAHDRHDPPDGSQALRDPLTLRADLVTETGAVGVGQLVVGAHASLKASRLGGSAVSILHDRRPQAKAPGGGRTPESRNLLRPAEGD